MTGSAVRKVVPCDRRDYHIFQSYLFRGMCHVVRFVFVRRSGNRRTHRAKAAVSGTVGAKNKERGSRLRKTFPTVRTPRLFTDRSNPVFPQNKLCFMPVCAALSPYPVREPHRYKNK